MMWSNGGFGWGGWIVMTLAMVAFWGLVVAGVLALFRSGRRADAAAAAHLDSPAEILDQRFARGEIDAQEYQARKNALNQAR